MDVFGLSSIIAAATFAVTATKFTKKFTKFLLTHGNKLTVLPDSVGNLTALTRLDLSDNQLTALPESVGNLTALTTLDLSDNQLTALPESVGNLTALTTLDLSGNQL